MANKKTKREIEDTDKTGIVMIIAILTVFAIIIGIAIANSLNWFAPTKTLYITSNHFPIKVAGGGNLNGNTTEYVFYGTLQPNGTECI